MLSKGQAYSHAYFAAPHEGSLPRRLWAALSVRLLGWLKRQAIRAELERLGDRTLTDLGLSRCDFPSIVDGTYQRGQ